MINFKAKLISTANVNRMEKNVPRSSKAAFAELNSLKKDLPLLEKIESDWDVCNKSFVSLIKYNFYRTYNDRLSNFKQNILKYLFNISKSKPENRFFVLTSQHRNYKNLSADKVLGIAEIKELKNCYDNAIKINFIQTNPTDKYPYNNREYSGVGRALVESIISLYPGNLIFLSAIKEVQGFYEKLGFVELQKVDAPIQDMVYIPKEVLK